MAKHRAPTVGGPPLMQRVRAYVARHVDRRRQPGRDVDWMPDDWFESSERLATDKDVWDR